MMCTMVDKEAEMPPGGTAIRGVNDAGSSIYRSSGDSCGLLKSIKCLGSAKVKVFSISRVESDAEGVDTFEQQVAMPITIFAGQ